MKQLLLLTIALSFITTSIAQSKSPINKTAGIITLPNNFVGEWTDECILDIYNKIAIKKEGNVFKATFKLGNVQVKSFSKIEGVIKQADGSFDFTVVTSSQRYKINAKNVSSKVILVKRPNDKKHMPLFSCKSIVDQDEFDQLQEKYSSY